MAVAGDSPKFIRDPAGVGSYHKFSDAKVAYSVPLSDLVIADYDASGALRGLDLVGKQTGTLETFIKLARKASLGPKRKPRGGIPGLARGV